MILRSAGGSCAVRFIEWVISTRAPPLRCGEGVEGSEGVERSDLRSSLEAVIESGHLCSKLSIGTSTRLSVCHTSLMSIFEYQIGWFLLR